MSNLPDFQDWREAGEHLPPFMRDFHDQKDLFKTIADRYSEADERPGREHYKVNWVNAQVYTIDRFLWFMAEHGYTLQQTRKRVRTYDIRQTLKEARDRRIEHFSNELKAFMARNKPVSP